MILKETLATALQDALERARQSGSLTVDRLPSVRLDVPPSPDLGDLSSDVAVTIARQTRQSPAVVADLLAANLQLPDGLVERVDVARSGFLNFHLPTGWLQAAIDEACAAGSDWGRSSGRQPSPRILVEFVSANPTTPLTVNHGRGAVLGDVLSRALEWAGFDVSREYYVNDAGSEAEQFTRRLEAAYCEVTGSPNGAKTETDEDFVHQIARKVAATDGNRYLSLPTAERLVALARAGEAAVLATQRETLDRLGVRFDNWRYERELLEAGGVDRVLDRLSSEEHAYEYEGALWLRTTQFGDYGDRPLRRGNGKSTYLAADLAYHLDKLERGYERLIDIWGPEHETYIPRTKAGLQALGCADEAVRILVFQPVTLEIDGIPVEGTGNNRTLDAVLDKVGRDAARFAYLSRSAGSPLYFHLDRGAEGSEGEPAERFLTAAERAAGSPVSAGHGAAGPDELALARLVAALPDEVRQAALEEDATRLARYAFALADAFEAFERSGGAGSDTSVVRAAAITFANLKQILGVGNAASSQS